MTPPMIHVRAKGDGCFAFEPDVDGKTPIGRFVGRVAGFATDDGPPDAKPEGEHVPATSHYHRGVMEGSLELVVATPAPPAATTAPTETE